MTLTLQLVLKCTERYDLNISKSFKKYAHKTKKLKSWYSYSGHRVASNQPSLLLSKDIDRTVTW